MQINGDISELKKSIDETYAQRLKEKKAKYDIDFAAIKEKDHAAQYAIRKTFEHKLKRETELLIKKESSLAICESRAKFDEDKQNLFENILTEVAKDKKSVDTKEYKAAVKSVIANISASDIKNTKLMVSTKNLVPSSFKGKVQVTKDHIGVKVACGASIIDLSLNTLIKTKKEELAVLLHAKLFD